MLGRCRRTRADRARVHLTGLRSGLAWNLIGAGDVVLRHGRGIAGILRLRTGVFLPGLAFLAREWRAATRSTRSVTWRRVWAEVFTAGARLAVGIAAVRMPVAGAVEIAVARRRGLSGRDRGRKCQCGRAKYENCGFHRKFL